MKEMGTTAYFWKKVKNQTNKIFRKPIDQGDPVRQLSEEFESFYSGLAREIDNHVRYEKDFSGVNSLNQGFKDPVNMETYALKLSSKIVSLQQTYHQLFQDESLDVIWICLVKLLYPMDVSIMNQLKEHQRIELAGIVLVILWGETDLKFGAFIRSYYQKVYSTDVSVLSGITPDKLLELLKGAAVVADHESHKKTSSAMATNKSAPDTKDQSSTILYSYFSHMGMFNKSAVQNTFTVDLFNWFGVWLWSVYLLMYIFLFDEVFIPIFSEYFTHANENIVLAFKVLGLFSVFYIVFKSISNSKLRIKKKLFFQGLDFLIDQKFVTPVQIHNFVVDRFGPGIARKLRM